MALNKAKGNMYNWSNLFTWNPLGGKCEHECKYCYVDEFDLPFLINKYSGEVRLIERLLQDNMGKNKIVFVQSCGDIFANNVPVEYIERILNHCNEYPLNTYLLQTKNPARIPFFEHILPPRVILGTTLETDDYSFPKMCKAPAPMERAKSLAIYKGRKMVSIEPIMLFNHNEMVEMIRIVDPEFVSIGANSGSYRFKEPSPQEIDELIEELRDFTSVRIKPNLRRLVGNTYDGEICDG
jgi:DNA repair photolyase